MKSQETGIVAVIRNKLEQELKPQRVEIADVSHKHAGHSGAQPGGNTHFEVHIVAECFRGLPRVRQHQLVYDALKGLMNNPIHALALRCEVP